jgi:hypothetical protein
MLIGIHDQLVTIALSSGMPKRLLLFKRRPLLDMIDRCLQFVLTVLIGHTLRWLDSRSLNHLLSNLHILSAELYPLKDVFDDGR